MFDLRHGDCRDILPTIPNNSVHLVFMDPPYGHNNADNHDLISRARHAMGDVAAGEEEHVRPILNDGEEANDIFREILPELRRVLVPGGCVC